MKQYSLKHLIFVAFVVSFITALAVSNFSAPLIARAAVNDFLQKLPFFQWLAPKTSEEVQEKIQQLVPEFSKGGPYQSASSHEAQIINVVKIASPAVVSVTVTKNVPIIEQYFVNPFGNDPFFRQFFGEEFQVPQYRQKGTKKQEVGGGSGFIISAGGLVLTNKHVVADTQAEYTVFTNDGKKYPAKVLARDPIQDLAVLKIEASDLPTLPLADSDQIQVGQTAIAIGNALGEFRNTVSVGVVSGLARSVTATGPGLTENLQNLIQTDAAINPGNSGGPLLNLNGEVMGINTAVAQGAQGIGFAIPINQAKRDINDAITRGKIVTPYLGIRYLTVTSAVQEEKKLPVDYGALVAKGEGGEAAIIKDSPADKAGIKEGDIILEFGDKRVDKDRQLASLVLLHSVGESVPVKVWRSGEIIDVNVTLSERPNL